MKLTIKSLIYHMQKKDSGVAVVIGTILLIAISISLISAYLFYYLPYDGALNEQTYYTQTEAAFNSLQIKMNNPSLVPGSIITQSIPIGVKGIPPFTTYTDTSVSYTNSSVKSSFSIVAKFNVTVHTASLNKNYTLEETFNSSGMLCSSAQLQYLNNFGYILTNGMLIRNEGKASSLLSGMGFSFTNVSDHYSLFTSLIELNGSTQYDGGYGSAIFQAEYANIDNTTLSINENSTTANLGLAPGTITNITLISYNYTANMTFSDLLNNYLIDHYNSSSIGDSKWTFYNDRFTVHLTGNLLRITINRDIKLSSISIDYMEADLLAL